VARAIGTLFERLLDLVFPPRCIGCQAYGDWLCPACLAGAAFLDSPRYVSFANVATVPALWVWSVGVHEGVLRQAVHSLKYENVRVLSNPMGRLMADVWRASSLSADCIVPVPLHPNRQRARGYNQAVLLARALAEFAQIPLAEQHLKRVRDTVSQVGLSAEERLSNVRGAFSAADSLCGKRVFLLDDVCTSGATLVACAAAISEKKGQVTGAITFTRVEARSPQP